MDDAELSRRLTAAVRTAPGVAAVYPAQPILEAAAGAIAVKLALRLPDILVDIDRADGVTRVSAQIAAEASTPAPDTLRTVGDLLRRLMIDSGENAGSIVVSVKVRLVDDGAFPA